MNNDESKRANREARWQERQARFERRMQQRHRSNHVWAGVFMLVIGVIFLANRLGFWFPDWLFTWPVGLIVLGLLIGVQSRFRNFASLVLILVGSAFLAKNVLLLPVNLERLIWPVALILIGLLLIIKPKRKVDWEHLEEWKRRRRHLAHYRHCMFTAAAAERTGPEPKDEADKEKLEKDTIDITTVFSSARRTVISKDFGGGEIISVFGGSEIDFMQADINGVAVVDVSIVFGGIKLILPANWEFRSNVTTIAAGIDDKRNTQGGTPDPNKVLIITGSVLFGGIEVRNY
jgi:predicted membrane protein